MLKLPHVAIQFLHDYHLEWKNFLKSFILNSCTLSIFPTLEIKKLVFVGKMLWRFNITFIAYMVNSSVFSVDIPVMINILYEMIKILCEKMLNAIYLSWFHNDTSEGTNSLNGHSNEAGINGWCSSYLLPSITFFI